MTTSLPKLKPEIKARWLKALRSGEYEQGVGRLHYRDEDGPDRFCCMGVLCDLAATEGVVSRYIANTGWRTRYGYAQETTMPPPEVTDWAFGVAFDPRRWSVRDHDEDAGDEDTIGLATLNDDHCLTFTQIADRIEEDL